MSNGAIVRVIGKDLIVVAPEIEEGEETPQQLAEWNPNVVFYTSLVPSA